MPTGSNRVGDRTPAASRSRRQPGRRSHSAAASSAALTTARESPRAAVGFQRLHVSIWAASPRCEARTRRRPVHRSGRQSSACRCAPRELLLGDDLFHKAWLLRPGLPTALELAFRTQLGQSTSRTRRCRPAGWEPGGAPSRRSAPVGAAATNAGAMRSAASWSSTLTAAMRDPGVALDADRPRPPGSPHLPVQLVGDQEVDIVHDVEAPIDERTAPAKGTTCSRHRSSTARMRQSPDAWIHGYERESSGRLS